MKNIWFYENEEQWAAGYTARAETIHAAGLIRVSMMPIPKNQKFKPGVFVMIAQDLGTQMSHFKNGRPACVMHTYQQAYGGSDTRGHQYSLLVRYDDAHWSSVAWYNEDQLEEITDAELLRQFRKELGFDDSTI